MTAVLDAAGAARLLQDQGLVGPSATARELDGGVSNTVVLVEDGARRVVMKQSLPRLKVAEEWLAKQERLLTEAAALRLAARIAPALVPGVLHVDRELYAIAIEAAPADWHSWKDDLLAGRVDPSVAETLGRGIGAWHAATAHDGAVAQQFDDHDAFEQLRIDPYYRTAAARVPAVAPAVEALVDRLSTRSVCLVHGDFSPKNFLVGDGRLWVLDWEVAHFGDPAFDVAFLTSHLVLKALHRGEVAPYRLATAEFWAAYDQARGPARHEVADVTAHLGALLVARARGKSPAEYLTPAGRDRAEAIGRSLLLDPATTLEDVWEQIG